ncbi:MAG: hypothetical protein R3F59_38720 [Myxococcota bacterium]
MKGIALAAVALLGACNNREPRYDPSAYTELGLPDARYQLGWGVEDVPWDTMTGPQRASVLHHQLVVLRSQAPDAATRATAEDLLRELERVQADGSTDLEALDALRDEVVSLEPPR